MSLPSISPCDGRAKRPLRGRPHGNISEAPYQHYCMVTGWGSFGFSALMQPVPTNFIGLLANPWPYILDYYAFFTYLIRPTAIQPWLLVEWVSVTSVECSRGRRTPLASSLSLQTPVLIR